LIFVQICEAINYCHRNRIIHRDLKLENIMFKDEQKKEIKIVDFGLAGSENKINVETTNAGSIRYICPEVIISNQAAYPGIDIWAIGVILYRLLSGYPPFDGSTKLEI